jgi:hypothetical protein
MDEWPVCPGCGERIGAYEPLWRVHPTTGAERTSWLRLTAGDAPVHGTLWHAQCAEDEGIDGG